MKRIKCFFGLHRVTTTETKYDLIKDMEVVGYVIMKLKICNNCNHAEISVEKLHLPLKV